MTLTRLFLGLQGLVFVLFGFFAFLNPGSLVDALGAAQVSSDGQYELRGIYGGVSVGLGFLLLFGALKPDMQRPALFALLAYTGGYALARFAAVPFDGLPGPRFMAFSAFEILTALISLYLIRKL